MLLQFSVSNFRAFRGRQTLNLAAAKADKSLPENCITPQLPGLKDGRWLKGAGLYGANASGKSTLIEALKALSDLVSKSASVTDPKAEISQIEPFALDPAAFAEPTAFAIVFVSGGVRYEYRIAATRRQILHESLRSFPKGPERLWFIREWSEEDQTFHFSPESPAGMSRNKEIERRTLPNMLYLSKAIAENRVELEPVFRYLVDGLIFFNLANYSEHGKHFTMKQLASGSDSQKAAIVKILQHADIGVTGIEVEERPRSEMEIRLTDILPKEEQDYYLIQAKQPKLLHQTKDGQSLPLQWKYESVGTKRLFQLVGPWLEILKEGLSVFIDELETSLHPHIVRELLALFFSKEHNPNGAQIIFTTHNPLLLDTTLIRRDQIWLTDKDQGGEAHLYPLTDYTPRKEESLVRGYLAGRYGAVPFIPHGLFGTERQSDSTQAANKG